jgi:hypothetical protein
MRAIATKSSTRARGSGSRRKRGTHTHRQRWLAASIVLVITAIELVNSRGAPRRGRARPHIAARLQLNSGWRLAATSRARESPKRMTVTSSRPCDGATARLRDCATARLRDCATARRPGCATARRPGCATARRPGCATARLHDCGREARREPKFGFHLQPKLLAGEGMPSRADLQFDPAGSTWQDARHS